MDNFKIDKDQMKSLENFSNIATSFMFKIIGWFTNVINFFSKYAKLLNGLFVLFILFQVGSYLMSLEPSGVYQITSHNGDVYNTDKIEIKDGCVYFTKMNNKDKVIICGGCTVVKND